MQSSLIYYKTPKSAIYTLRTRLKTGFGTYHFRLVLILAILTWCYIIPIINDDLINNKKRRFEDATADILRRINADHGGRRLALNLIWKLSNYTKFQIFAIVNSIFASTKISV